MVIRYLVRPFLRLWTSFAGCGLHGASVCLPSRATALCCLLSSGSTSHPVIQDLLQPFRLSSAGRQLRPPAWDLSVVLRFFNSSAFEPLSEASLRALSQKMLFLLALTTAKYVGELQVLSSVVTFVGSDAFLSYVPQFVV